MALEFSGYGSLGWTVLALVTIYSTGAEQQTEAVENSGIESVACWATPRVAGQDADLERVIRDFGNYLNASVVGDGVNIEIRQEEANYTVSYFRHMPRYGRLVETYWPPDGPSYAEWDEELRLRISEYQTVTSCKGEMRSWIGNRSDG
jgi:hypothetical protein